MEFVGLPVVLELDKARDTVEVSFLLLLHDEPEGHVVDSRDTIHARPLELVVTETKEAVDLFEVLPHDDLPHSRVNLVEVRSEEHTSELKSLMRISYAVFCLKKKKIYKTVMNYIYRPHIL